MKTAGAPLQMVELLTNRVLGMDADARSRLAPLDGSRVSVQLQGYDLDCEVEFTSSGVRIGEATGQPVDAHISGPPSAWLRMAREVRAGRVGGIDLKISGDAEVVQRLGRALGQLDIDWEEQLSKYVGDALARNATLVFRSLERWLQERGRTFFLNLSEYLAEESRLLPSVYELEHFTEGVDQTRDDVERLSVRVARLSRVTKASE